MSQTGAKIVVVGAGIVGAACAAALAKEGFGVLVLDAGCMAGGATAAGMGHIVVMDDSEAQFALTEYSRRLWGQLKEALPKSAEYHSSGTMWVAADADEMAEVERKRAYFARRGVRAEVLDARALAEAEPNLRPGLAGGLRVAGDGVVYPPVVAATLLEQAKRSGAQVRTHARVKRLEGRSVLLESGENIGCDMAVNAAGSWSPALTAGLPIRPRKGHLAITDRYPGYVRHHLVELGYLKSAHSVDGDSVAFNVQPRVTGQLLIGSSRQFDDDSPEIRLGILRKMMARAVEYLPGLGELTVIRTWTGFRAATPDKLPLIGPMPGHEGLWLATGHEGLGITTSLGTARLLVDAMLGRKPEIPMEPYLPSRPGREAGHG